MDQKRNQLKTVLDMNFSEKELDIINEKQYGAEISDKVQEAYMYKEVQN